ncbi:MAG TPA: glycerol-3-phosphate 1-O-acyltransferase PlsY [Gemmatimonadaceae bacterium]|nr:glycerol-3-phosphate 1-O-acyltransferase PlsY [Gemmatimonadaceae bacterium]
MHPVAAVVIAYLAGSIPFAYLAGKARGVDLRKHGSGNLGATNAVRVLGVPTGAAVYLLDTLKGFLPVFVLVPMVAADRLDLWAIAIGVAAIVGHVRPVYLGFQKGGKGVATAGGVFLALAPVATALGLAVWLLVFLPSGYVSLASIATAALFPLAMLATGTPVRSALFAAAVAMALFVIWTHRANIARLRRGEEHRFRRGKRAPDESHAVSRGS